MLIFVTMKEKTALMLAAGHGYNLIVRDLIKAGADVNMTDNDGETALTAAAEIGSVKCIDILVSSGAKCTTSRTGQSTALVYAVYQGLRKWVEIFIQQRADVNSRFFKCHNTGENSSDNGIVLRTN